MYKCQICQQIVPPKTPCSRVVLKTRKKFYPMRAKAYRGSTGKFLDRRDDPGGVGIEAVIEVNACPTCASSKLN